MVLDLVLALKMEINEVKPQKELKLSWTLKSHWKNFILVNLLRLIQFMVPSTPLMLTDSVSENKKQSQAKSIFLVLQGFISIIL